jgi:hypothetical protein
MWTPTRLNNGQESEYGFGWALGRVRGHRLVGHGGGRPGTATQISRFPDEGVTVIVLINGRGDPGGISRRVAGYFIPGLTLHSMNPEKDANPEFTQQLKKCLIELAEKKDSEMLTPEFRKNFSNSKRRFAELQNDIKGLKSFAFITNDDPGQLKRLDVPIARLSSYKIETADGPRFYTFSLTADQKVGWIEATD